MMWNTMKTLAATGLAVGLLSLNGQSVSAMPLIYGDRTSFEATLDALITDDYSAPGYLAGNIINLSDFDVHSDANMNAVLGETRYEATGIADNFIISTLGNPYYCTGCNGSYRLDFTSTSVGTLSGVFGVGLDVIGVEEGVFGTIAFVTFGDGSTENYAIPEMTDVFWGITSETLISTIHFGLLDGAPNSTGIGQRMAHDNLTIGSMATQQVSEPGTLALLGLALASLGFGRFRKACI